MQSDAAQLVVGHICSDKHTRRWKLERLGEDSMSGVWQYGGLTEAKWHAAHTYHPRSKCYQHLRETTLWNCSAWSDLPASVVPGLRAFFRLICILYRYKNAGTTRSPQVPGLTVVPRLDLKTRH
jgi:hypothetical protein